MNRKEKGLKGEEEACVFLKDIGYRILARNFRGFGGEIDIVAGDEGKIVFVEVKAWETYEVESLEQAISKKKQKRILNAAKYFLILNPGYNDIDMRFDVVFLSNHSAKILHIKHAFGETSG